MQNWLTLPDYTSLRGIVFQLSYRILYRPKDANHFQIEVRAANKDWGQHIFKVIMKKSILSDCSVTTVERFLKGDPLEEIHNRLASSDKSGIPREGQSVIPDLQVEGWAVI